MHATGREKFIGFFNSFHGRTLGSLSLTSSKSAQRMGFKRQALDVIHVPYPNEFRNPFVRRIAATAARARAHSTGSRSACSRRLRRLKKSRQSWLKQFRVKVDTCLRRKVF
jgi:4-aminobutyrate aminotransferase-like enzyme